MKRALLALILTFWTSALMAQANPIQVVTHHSLVLGREKTYSIYVPPDAAEGERFPVLFVMHGATGSHEDWPTRTNVAELAARMPVRMILVFPDGDPYGWYVNSPLEPHSQMETYIARELVDEIDAHYPTVPDRNARGIMGLSMGGHGAFLIAGKYPEVFGSASAMSAIMDIARHPDKWSIAERLGPHAENVGLWQANSVYHQAERFLESDTRLLFDCGSSDVLTGAIGDSRALHERLVDLGVPHIWREFPGTHSWDYWGGHLPEHLAFHQAAMIDHVPERNRWETHYFKRLQGFFDENARLAVEPETERPTMVFLGSSSFEGLSSDYFPSWRIFNRGIVSDNLGLGGRGIWHRLEESVFDLRPDIVMFMNGRNDLGNQQRSGGTPTTEDLVAQYDRIVTAIRERLPETTLVINLCPSTSGTYDFIAEATADYNTHIRALAARHELEVIDMFEATRDDNNRIRPEMTTDGLHLSRAGREVWVDMLNATLARLQAEQPTR